jgi:hypothetical protein
LAAFHSSITPELQTFIAAQPMFFVGSAPLSGDGHINLSPKGLDTLRVLSPKRVSYLDVTGSGNETAAHLLENGRITLMFCAFADPPKILRLYRRGRAVQPGDAEWSELAAMFAAFTGTRQIVVAEITRIQTSCGFGVPLMKLEAQRTMLEEWARTKGEEGLKQYRKKKNRSSIDGLPTTMERAGDSAAPFADSPGSPAT